jgi:enamine deaminase RidA (YjgF/YER057c/UK114 family)
MSRTAARLQELGIVLPPPVQAPGGINLPFPFINVRADRAIISGHPPQNPDGSLAGPFGKVGAEVTLEQAHEVARKVGLSILGSLQRELGDLDRVAGWVRVFGMVNSAPGFDRHPAVINGFSDLILAVFGHDIGRHARSAISVAALPFNIAVEIEAEVLVRT